MHPFEHLSPPLPPGSTYCPPSSDVNVFTVAAARLQDSHSAQQAGSSSSSQRPQPQYPIKIPPEKQAKALELYTIFKLAEALAENAKTTEREDCLFIPSDYIRSAPQTRSAPPRIAALSDHASGHQIESYSSVVSFNEVNSFDGKIVKQRSRKRLNPVARGKAALIRYLGSCWPCRSKRIPVSNMPLLMILTASSSLVLTMASAL
jgi:hypothetical protein